jgi:hypothetical protein
VRRNYKEIEWLRWCLCDELIEIGFDDREMGHYWRYFGEGVGE